jgi:hypothetical protein
MSAGSVRLRVTEGGGDRNGGRRTVEDCESIDRVLGRGVMVARHDIEVDAPILTEPAGVLLGQRDGGSSICSPLPVAVRKYPLVATQKYPPLD